MLNLPSRTLLIVNLAIFQLNENTMVCSEHFKSEDYIFKGYTTKKQLKPGAFPTVFEWSAAESHSGRKPPKARLPVIPRTKGVKRYVILAKLN